MVVGPSIGESLWNRHSQQFMELQGMELQRTLAQQQQATPQECQRASQFERDRCWSCRTPQPQRAAGELTANQQLEYHLQRQRLLRFRAEPMQMLLPITAVGGANSLTQST